MANKNPPTSDTTPPAGGIVLTPAQIKSRRQRNLAIGLLVTFFVLLIYAISIIKMGAVHILGAPL